MQKFPIFYGEIGIECLYMKKRPSIDLKLSVNFIKEGKSVIAYSPALDLSTCGKNENEARKRFEETVQLFFEDIIERNTHEEVLT